MRKLNLNLAFVLLLTVGGCSQILGIGDYEIDPKLDGSKIGVAGERSDAGEGGAGNDEGKAGSGGKSGSGANGGKSGSGANGGKSGSGANGGAVTTPEGGAGGGAGEPMMVEPTAGQGQGGEPPVMTGGSAGAAGEGGGGNPPRVVLPCTDESCCTQAGGVAEGQELLITSASTEPPSTYYGDFELGKDGEGSPWTEVSDNFYLVVDADAGAPPHKGTYFAWLGGAAMETNVVESEAFDVPEDAGWLTLSGFRKFQLDSDATDDLNTDDAYISLSDEDSYVDDFYDWGPGDTGETNSWSSFKLSLDASAHQGTTRYLDVAADTDDYHTDSAIEGSNYEFDDLSLKVFRCYQP